MFGATSGLKCRTIPFADHLREPLEQYLSKIQKVRLIRAKERLGLIKARSVAMAEARASTITVLDSQCECYPGKYQYRMPTRIRHVMVTFI